MSAHKCSESGGVQGAVDEAGESVSVQILLPQPQRRTVPMEESANRHSLCWWLAGGNWVKEEQFPL